MFTFNEHCRSISRSVKMRIDLFNIPSTLIILFLSFAVHASETVRSRTSQSSLRMKTPNEFAKEFSEVKLTN